MIRCERGKRQTAMACSHDGDGEEDGSDGFHGHGGCDNIMCGAKWVRMLWRNVQPAQLYLFLRATFRIRSISRQKKICSPAKKFETILNYSSSCVDFDSTKQRVQRVKNDGTTNAITFLREERFGCCWIQVPTSQSC